MPWLFNLRDRVPALCRVSERVAGFSARRSLPTWRSDVYRDDANFPPPLAGESQGAGKEVVLFADTFNRYFERENLDAAHRVLTAAGYRVHAAAPQDGKRPLCCGRTFLAVGAVDEARAEMARTLDALAPYVTRGVPVVGLEPSCLLSFRDELHALMKGEAVDALSANALLFEEFLVREHKAGRLSLPLKPLPQKALLHGHCHQKAFAAMGAVEGALRLIPELQVETIESSCCGMAGAFGYDAETIDVSLAMGELSLLPAVRKASADAIIVADGTSCRHQIHDGAAREALHVARVLEMSLKRAG
jgi:Fe-S oxidoreductase